jgi:PfaB family protein
MKKKAPIAIVAMSGVFPGAPDLATFWHNIINKVNTVCESSEKRWGAPPETMYRPVPTPDMAISKRACLIQNFTFNPCGFDIAPDLLKDMDPLYHLVLHAGREAMAAIAGRKDDESVRMRTGVTLAAMALPTDSASLLAREVLGRAFEARLLNKRPSQTHARLSRTQCLSAKVTSLPGALLAQALGLGGGSLTLDAACASSLYAVKLACDELHAGRADAMLAGGVSRPDCLYTQVGFSQLKALSPSGRCAPFDVTADGLVVGEGVGLLVLKRLDDALRDQDKILGLIRGIGLSNDMQGNLLAPDSEGQLRALRYAYQAAGWSPSDVDLIECHGTGTPLGDVTELRSLRELWGADGWTQEQCAIGSVKSMIGHLLTGAGAAGLIKILLALQPPDDKTAQLPPSLHFDRAPQDSPLHGSPFRVQCETQPWKRRNDQTPRRAAINAFGFGGINAHLLIEEFMTNDEFPIPSSPFPVPHSELPQIAIVGMETVFGPLASLKQFQEAVFNGRTVIGKRPPQRWRGSDALAHFLMEDTELYGSFMEEVVLTIGEFHIPPNEIPDILVQHLLMLKVCAKAMRDAGLPLRANRPDMGVIIGLEFDYEATDFHLRWDMPNHIETWLEQSDLQLNDAAKAEWLEKLQDAIGPPLTHARTLNALPSIAASRIAREFRLGGPGFVVSCEAASGLRALEIGVRALQNGEMDTVLIGAVDLTGDVRNLMMADKLNPFSRSDQIRPFDKAADGTLPGEGAVAMVLMPLDQALKDGHRIYATIKGIGAASGPIGNLESGIRNSTDAYKRAIQDADISPSSISYIETHGSGCPAEDALELGMPNSEFSIPNIAIGSVKPIIGHTGAAAGLASLAKTALCLYHQIIPPLPNYITPSDRALANGAFFMPQAPQYWIRNRNQGPRHAAVNAFTSDGNYSSVILEGGGHERSTSNFQLSTSNIQHQPLGEMHAGLFVISNTDESGLLAELDRFEQFLDERLSADLPLESVARDWYHRNRSQTDRQEVVTMVAADHQKLRQRLNNARKAVLSGVRALMSAGGVAYNPLPLGKKGEIAFVFPGSGNHYVGMGREIGVVWPEILRKIDAGTERLKSQMRPHCYVPWRTDWHPGWEKDAYSEIIADPLNTIFGQVVHGGVMAGLMNHFAIQPSAIIGYSLGESAGLFASGAWPERGAMLERMLKTDLFTTQLAGPCLAARQAWNIPEHEAVDWRVALVNRSADTVGDAIRDSATARLLIINTPEQCVIGGMRRDIEAAIQKLKCEAVFLDGVVTVHCDAAQPVADAYRELHHFPVTPPPGIRYYSCAWGRSYKLTSDNAADSIRDQATGGFDFPALIHQAYDDGVRIFVEMGPHNSCTRMINKILGDRPFTAVSADMRGESDYLTVLKCLGALIAEGLPANMASLKKLYGDEIRPQATEISATSAKGKKITRILGGAAPEPMLPEIAPNETQKEIGFFEKTRFLDRETRSPNEESTSPNDLIESQTASMNATAQAHQQFLKFSADAGRSYADAFALQNRLLAHQIRNSEFSIPNSPFQIPHSEPAFTREQCMEFAIGSAANVLGPDFAVIDTYDVRVRLPDEPLMLADRIISVQGEKRSLTSGCVVTEHDVLADAWYLDGGRAPVCIAVEAGQADLFLCSYLGIDHAVKGRRSYRLLDAKVKFHRGLPRPGEVIRYVIHIRKFVRQGETYLFFFDFEGSIDGAPLITMTDGCAGFFTKEEVTRAGGLVLTAAETEPQRSANFSLQGVRRNRQAEDCTPGSAYEWLAPMPVEPESYDDTQIDALRRGDLASCFGSGFDGVKPAESIYLPGGRMKLIDRVLRIDAQGGRFGLGQICAEADIHPNDWFLTCHFIDDMVMPGTLMYECCAHTLRVFLWRMGWVTDKPDVCYEPVCEVQSELKCRGPVTTSTKKVLYQVDIREIGTHPEPYMIADALMFVDDLPMVAFKSMSMQMSGVTHDELENFWTKRLPAHAIRHDQTPLFDRHHILEFAEGKPSAAFGEPYKPFDTKFIARLPRPPYAFIDRIVAIEPQAWVLKPDGWIEAEYDVPPSEWYFAAERSFIMPYCILLEIALQPCGWLAAYLGSALKIDQPLRFRNLGGKAVLHQALTAESGTVTIRVRLTKVAEAGAMIIEHFDFKVLQGQHDVYTGNTYFGYFTREALAEQAGIRGAAEKAYSPNEHPTFNIEH